MTIVRVRERAKDNDILTCVEYQQFKNYLNNLSILYFFHVFRICNNSIIKLIKNFRQP